MPCSTLHYGGKGALCTPTLMWGHRFIQTIHLLRTFFRHVSNKRISASMHSGLLHLPQVVPCIRHVGSSVGPAFKQLGPPQTPAHPDGVCNMPPKQSELPPQLSRMSADGKRLALMWHAKDGIGPTAIGDRLRRSPSSISRLLCIMQIMRDVRIVWVLFERRKCSH